jgi:hypothetical protein
LSFGLAQGGAVPTGDMGDETPGGSVPTSASPTQGIATDDVPARLTADEFVIPKDVMLWEGQKSMYGIIDKARKAMQQANARPDIGGQPTQAIPTPPTFQSTPQAIPMGAH